MTVGNSRSRHKITANGKDHESHGDELNLLQVGGMEGSGTGHSLCFKKTDFYGFCKLRPRTMELIVSCKVGKTKYC